MSFTGDLSKFCNNTAPEYVAGVIRDVVFEIHTRLNYRSPVGKPSNWENPDSAPPGYAGGTFRRNWQYGFNTIPSSFIEEIDPSGGKALGLTASGLASSRPSGVHYLVNNAPYAQRLEDGHSKYQAPHGIVSLTEMEFPEIFRRASA